jgi:hypothetical protein
LTLAKELWYAMHGRLVGSQDCSVDEVKNANTPIGTTYLLDMSIFWCSIYTKWKEITEISLF